MDIADHPARTASRPLRQAALLLEAAWELFRARLETLRSPCRYMRRADGSAAPGSGGAVLPAQDGLAAEIGTCVRRAARLVPFRARCLQQALAVRRMLVRRGIPVVVHVGVARDRSGRAAHAWVTAGDRVVSGDTNLDQFVVVLTF